MNLRHSFFPNRFQESFDSNNELPTSGYQCIIDILQYSVSYGFLICNSRFCCSYGQNFLFADLVLFISYLNRSIVTLKRIKTDEMNQRIRFSSQNYDIIVDNNLCCERVFVSIYLLECFEIPLNPKNGVNLETKYKRSRYYSILLNLSNLWRINDCWCWIVCCGIICFLIVVIFYGDPYQFRSDQNRSDAMWLPVIYLCKIERYFLCSFITNCHKCTIRLPDIHREMMKTMNVVPVYHLTMITFSNPFSFWHHVFDWWML